MDRGLRERLNEIQFKIQFNQKQLGNLIILSITLQFLLTALLIYLSAEWCIY